MSLELSSSSSPLSNNNNTAAAAASSNAKKSCPSQYKKHIRVPKKIHKSEREKLKRERLNDLFLDLGLTLEPTRQNNGKASILNDTIKLLKALMAQVQTLRKEHITLLNESKYVTQEKDELVEENNVLVMEIDRLQIDMGERMQSSPTWRTGVSPIPSLSQRYSAPSIQQPPPLGPLLVIPLGQDPSYMSSLPSRADEQTTATPELASTPVRKPHARYPTPMDSWTFDLLAQQPRKVGDVCGPLAAVDGEDEGGLSAKELELLR